MKNIGSILLLKNFDSDSIFLFITTSTFILVGIILMIESFMKTIYKKTHCTEDVVGTIIDYDSKYINGKKKYTPIYEVHYNGTIYKLYSEAYCKIKKMEIGQDVDLKVDPENPITFISPYEKIVNFTLLFFGIGCIVGGMMPLFFMTFVN